MARVLVIDDECVVRELIVDALELAGHEVVAVANAQAGLDAARSGEFELVIADIVLPDGTGYDTMAVLGRQYPHLKFLVISGGSERLLEAYRIASGFDGAHRTLEKPFRIEELLRVVKEATA